MDFILIKIHFITAIITNQFIVLHVTKHTFNYKFNYLFTFCKDCYRLLLLWIIFKCLHYGTLTSLIKLYYIYSFSIG